MVTSRVRVDGRTSAKLDSVLLDVVKVVLLGKSPATIPQHDTGFLFAQCVSGPTVADFGCTRFSIFFETVFTCAVKNRYLGSDRSVPKKAKEKKSTRRWNGSCSIGHCIGWARVTH